MSSLLVRGGRVTPESAGWSYVGFEVATPPLERSTDGTELCIVVIAGGCTVRSSHGEWRLGERPDPWSGPPAAAYLPPGTAYGIEGDAELGLCTAPARTGAEPRVLAPGEVEVRGHGVHERTIQPILLDDEPAEALLVCEVLTPPGHWSSHPPHKHDRDALPEESYLEETYYHRISPPQGFALQRVYTDDGALDETVAVRDRDVVLVPRGYHVVSAAPGYANYYLNVMAGPVRAWVPYYDPEHAWTR